MTPKKTLRLYWNGKLRTFRYVESRDVYAWRGVALSEWPFSLCRWSAMSALGRGLDDCPQRALDQLAAKIERVLADLGYDVVEG